MPLVSVRARPLNQRCLQAWAQLVAFVAPFVADCNVGVTDLSVCRKVSARLAIAK